MLTTIDVTEANDDALLVLANVLYSQAMRGIAPTLAPQLGAFLAAEWTARDAFGGVVHVCDFTLPPDADPQELAALTRALGSMARYLRHRRPNSIFLALLAELRRGLLQACREHGRQARTLHRLVGGE